MDDLDKIFRKMDKEIKRLVTARFEPIASIGDKVNTERQMTILTRLMVLATSHPDVLYIDKSEVRHLWREWKHKRLYIPSTPQKNPTKHKRWARKEFYRHLRAGTFFVCDVPVKVREGKLSQ